MAPKGTIQPRAGKDRAKVCEKKMSKEEKPFPAGSWGERKKPHSKKGNGGRLSLTKHRRKSP